MTEKTNIIEEIEKNLREKIREKILAEYKAREKVNNLKLAIASSIINRLSHKKEK